MEAQEAAGASLWMKKYKPRWSQAEELMLVQEVLLRQSRLFGPTTEGGVINRNASGIRKDAWSEIADVLNSTFPTEVRDYESTRKKYYNFRNKARTKLEIRNKISGGSVEKFSKGEALILGLNYDETNASLFDVPAYSTQQMVLDLDSELQKELNGCTSTYTEYNSTNTEDHTARARRSTKRKHEMTIDDPIAYENEKLNLKLQIQHEKIKVQQLQFSLLETNMTKARLEIETLKQKREIQNTKMQILSLKRK